MRIAVLILTLVVGTVAILPASQTLTVGIGQLPKEVWLSLVVALLWIVAGAFVLRYPLASAGSLMLAASVGLLGGFSLRSAELGAWGAVSLVLVVLAFLGWRELQ